MDILSVFQLIGGIGLFLYGMKYLGASLQNVAGARLEKTLAKFTDNRAKGFSLGILVTALIQSSSATTIMLVGFVNAGLMKLVQAVPVLLGANIGTTVTGQILRLGDVSGDGTSFLTFIKPSSFAPLLIGVAAFIMLIVKKKKVNNIAAIIMGFGIIFFGMTTMENALSPLSSSESFREMFTGFSNPLIGVLMGILLAAILQSSSAAVGIVQAIAAATGDVTFSIAAPMIIGISIGKLFPVLLSSIGTKREAQQVTVSQLLISSFGAILGLIVIYLILRPLGVINWESQMNRGNIADLNTVYNIAASFVMLPFCGVVAKIARKLRPATETNEIDEALSGLTDLLLKTPSVALSQCRSVINNMGKVAVENYSLAIMMHDKYDPAIIERINDNERFLDKSETVLSDYMVKVTSLNLRPEEIKLTTEIMHSIMDFERIGDHCVKISDVATYNHDAKIKFTNMAKEELVLVADAVNEILLTTVNSFTNDEEEKALRVEPLAKIVNNMGETIKENHVRRLQAGDCSVQAGISLVELLTSFDRVAAYCSNIALHVVEKHTSGSGFDIHGYAKDMRANSQKYKDYYFEYAKKYEVPLTEKING
ncbi:MAG: Na/Pi cotransporter family protein [Lachnospiraceae bacterium]|nr:Na/Pi cotransporter family protein [Lachnospiraceae bacterium]